jgi:hypothetical protein
MIRKRTALAALAAILASAPACAAVTISTAATQNMNCSGGTCVPTATKAVLNAGDLQNYLSQFGNVHVMTTGNGVEANNIVVHAAFASPDSTSLTLDAKGAISVNAPVSIGSGTAELELQSGKGGELGTISFGRKGNITFGNLSDIFGINGGIFTLVGSVQELASSVSANPSGAFALANSYDASQDGTYSASPVTTTFLGAFEGLGNTISQLSVDDETGYDTGLFETLGSSGIIENIRLTEAQILSRGQDAGGLVGFAEGTIVNSSVDVAYLEDSSEFSVTGGLVGDLDFGTVMLSHATGPISGGVAGGLIGLVGGVTDQCYATGKVASVGSYKYAGGLAGYLEPSGSILNSYATGRTRGPKGYVPGIGGLVGVTITGSTRSTIGSSYSTGAQKRGRKTVRGGFMGSNEAKSTAMTNDHWDTTTSGTTKGVGMGSDTGVKGLTTQQLQSGLPKGFDRKIWAEKSGVNNGLPYLIHNPPPK